MTKRALLLTLLATLPFARAAQGQNPDAEKAQLVEDLVTALRLEQNLPEIMKQMNGYMTTQIEQSLGTISAPPADRKKITDDFQAFTTKLFAITNNALAWEKIKPLYIKVYSDTFSAEELRAALEFFKTPAGRAWNAKTPALAGAMMQATQQHMASVTPLLQKMSNDFLDEIRRKYGTR